MGDLKRTPLRDFHAAHGARLVDFAGWEMPVQYRSILEEHKAVRRAAGLFDVSHMGEVDIHGPGASAFLNSLVTSSTTC
jgi:aminomethyltransferase